MNRIKYTAAGFEVDAETLFEKFFNSPNKIRYSSFALAWKQMGFTMIFAGRTDENELHEFIEEMYSWCLTQLKPNLPFERRVGGLYLLYSLFVKQPRIDNSDGFTIRITYSNWEYIRQLLAQAKLRQHWDVCYVWYKLNSYGGVHFVHHYRPIGPAYIKNVKITPQEKTTPTNQLINQLTRSINPKLNELTEVHEQYRGMKEILSEEPSGSEQQPGTSEPILQAENVSLVQDNIFELFKVKMQNLKDGFHEKHHKNKEQNSSSQDHNSDSNSNFQITSGQVVLSKDNQLISVQHDVGLKRKMIKEMAMGKTKPTNSPSTSGSKSDGPSPTKRKRGRPKKD